MGVPIMSSVRKRIIFDLLLTLVLVFELLHQLTGNTLHEIVGIAFFVCIIAHLTFASRWIKSTASAFRTGEATKQQKRLAAVAALLALDVIVLAVSSVMISELLWKAGIDLTGLNPGKIWYPVHTVAAYVLCILVIGHLAMHWVTVAKTLSIRYDPSRREAISQTLNGVVIIGGIALGITGLVRAGFQASDYAVNASDAEPTKTVESGYREVNAQTGEYAASDSFETTSISNEDGAAADTSESAADTAAPICPICPRQCKLSAPRCERPYEAGLI